MSSEIKDNQNNKIVKIKVKSLFGLFDYDIPLNDNGVTILIGVNGSGKSTIFKILHNILRAKFYNILDVDFKSFEVYFESGDFVKCERASRSVDVDNLSLNVAGNKRLENYDHFRRGFQNLWNQSKILHDFSITVSSINHKLISSKINEDKNEVRYVVYEKTSELNTILDKLVTESRFIETQRLQLNYTDFDNLRNTINERNYLLHRKQLKLDGTYLDDYDVATSNSRIQEYASDLSKIIKSERSNYFAESQDVEKKTLSEYFKKSNIDFANRDLLSEIEDIEDDISKMEEHMTKLLDLGIYKSGEMSHILESKTLSSSLEHLKTSAKNTIKEELKSQADINKFLDHSVKSSLLKSYAENMRKKLDLFEYFETKIGIFTKHINNLFEYKEMEIDLEKGFIFKLNAGLEEGRIINPINLSSGEQHEVILNYELIFKTEENSVILMDEPEISLHMLWQKKFIDNLLDIAERNNLNIIVATHSPDIVNNHRNLVRVLSKI